MNEAILKKDVKAVEETLKNAKKIGIPKTMLVDGQKFLDNYNLAQSKKTMGSIVKDMQQDIKMAIKEKDIAKLSDLIGVATDFKLSFEVIIMYSCLVKKYIINFMH
jgi:hypothetical protein